VKGSIIAGSLVVVGAAMLFGTLSYIARQAEAVGIGAFAFVFWRGALASAVLIGVTAMAVAARRSRLPDPRRLSRRQQTRFLLACAVGALLNMAMFVAFLRTEVAVVLITFYIFPAIVTVGAVRFYGERLDLARGGALVLAMAGLVLVLVAPLLSAGRLDLDPLGVGLALLAALCQATFLLLSGRGYPPLSSLHVSIYVIGAAGLLALPLALFAGDPQALVQPFVDGQAWIWVVAGGITGAAIPTTMLLTGMNIIGPSRTAILMTVEPVVGVAIAGLLLHEQPVPLQLVGGAAVLAAAIILQAGPRGPRSVVPEETGEYQQLV
jgi:drug/metabolite transporter (DMT)-like permease